jgi:hypothetical protein
MVTRLIIHFVIVLWVRELSVLQTRIRGIKMLFARLKIEPGSLDGQSNLGVLDNLRSIALVDQELLAFTRKEYL